MIRHAINRLIPASVLSHEAQVYFRDSLRPGALVLAAGYLIMAISSTIRLPPSRWGLLLGSCLTSAGIMLAVAWLLRRKPLPLRWANPMGMGYVALMLANLLLFLLEFHHGSESIHVALLMIGAGLLFLSPGWFLGSIILVVASWALTLHLSDIPNAWSFYPHTMAGMVILATFAYSVRAHTLGRLFDAQQRLAKTNVELRTSAEQLGHNEEHFRLLADSYSRLLTEVNHRVRNNLASLRGVVQLTARRSQNVADFSRALEGRIHAMARVHNLLSQRGWSELNLHTLIHNVITAAPCNCSQGTRVRLEGPPVGIASRQAVPLVMCLMELYTNACKYGPHRCPNGRLDITWTTLSDNDSTRLRLRWHESGGSPVHRPIIPSLGTELIEGFIRYELGGQCELHYPDHGADHALEFDLQSP